VLVQRAEPRILVVVSLRNIFPFPLAEQLRAKAGKTMRGCAAAGIVSFARTWGKAALQQQL